MYKRICGRGSRNSRLHLLVLPAQTHRPCPRRSRGAETAGTREMAGGRRAITSAGASGSTTARRALTGVTTGKDHGRLLTHNRAAAAAASRGAPNRAGRRHDRRAAALALPGGAAALGGALARRPSPPAGTSSHPGTRRLARTGRTRWRGESTSAGNKKSTNNRLGAGGCTPRAPSAGTGRRHRQGGDCGGRRRGTHEGSRRGCGRH